MQKVSLAVAVLIGAVSTVKINWAQGLEENEIVDSKFDSFAQTTADAAAKSGSGVRAKWIELPNCQDKVVAAVTGVVWDPAAGEVIPLEADLSNAIIATCKGAYVAVPIAVPTPPTAITTNIPVAQSQIYDPVWKTDTVIPDQEHQVSQLQHGKVNATDQTTGPTGDFWPAWKYTNGNAQPHQTAGDNSWSNEGAGGNNSTNAATSPTNYGPNPTPVPASLIQFLDTPSESETEIETEAKWVELPVCTGAAGEVTLYFDKSNATLATCKKSPWDAAPEAPVPVAPAAAAPAAPAVVAKLVQDNSMIQFLEVPSEDVVIPIQKTVDEESKWVELPTCSGAAGEVVLFLGKENATSATCKKSPWESAPPAPADAPAAAPAAGAK